MGSLCRHVAVGASLFAVATAQIRVRLSPSTVNTLAEPDFHTWAIENESQNASTTLDSLDLTLSVSPESDLEGNSYKYQYTRPISHLGERVVNQGITTSSDNPGPITLTIQGLEAGEHTLLTWHNAWDSLDSTATISVSVDGEDKASDIEQSIRVDNIWETATSYVTFTVDSAGQPVEIVYTPSSVDGLVYLNGFEVDTPALKDQISFPSPSHRDEHLQLGGDDSITATWRAPYSTAAVTYNVYMGNSSDALDIVKEGLSETQVALSGLNTMDTFYWRVDVISGNSTYTGRIFMFRLAQLAFPGAEGYGRFARGGRGGKVVKVTSLEDSEEPGTLRYALAVATGPRIVVFDVGGVITINSRLTVSDSYVTVAGQTAPGKGIAVQGHPLGLSGASDVIFRHVRVRPGSGSGETVDGMGMAGSNYCILDRCSMGWGIDECFSSRTAHNITFQRNMISEPLNVAGHKNYPEGTAHGYAATIGGDVGSFHHNLISHAEGRSWSMGGGVDDNSTFAGRLDIRNNVVYNFGSRVTDGGAKEVNFVGNLYKQGPASELTYALKATYEDNLPGTQQYHCAGNSMPDAFDQDSVQYPPGDGTGQTSKIACYADVSIDPAPEYQKFFDEPFFPSYIEEHTSTEAYKRVLSDSGASQPVVDDHDKRIIQETLNGTATYSGSKTGKPGLIDNEADVGGLEEFPTTTRPTSWDANDDGIADWWDDSTGGDGYTVIEGYINFMAEPHVFVAPGASVKYDLAGLAGGFSNPAFEVSGGGLGSVSVDGTVATYTAGDQAGVDRFIVTISDDEDSTWERSVGVAIFDDAESVE
ncbi:pectate lyase [Aspergillus nomiae NRRL 13137]|uniref:Pectate lyase n=1 Tax=Aspergillus nomiae NRRL (strain ATCC 15546 / NRRL 13137 / CBS 260.88 / M93) TaxID=1509407 RepID=A0A0L1JCG6_ASPN3|nr:pectate lyase [Aspergillus nomiae NRRL 13137]KNG89451.1 pectate lyase [Aspergillus nomiae NRRL 13137]